ncbi:MAG: hypothetical protein RLZZ21_2930, partial [Planctomycetota bacterium]
MSAPRLVWLVAPVFAILAASGPGQATVAAAADQPAVVSFVEAGSTAVGEPPLVATAVGIRARGLASAESADVLVLVDTSASQAGLHRERQLEAVQAILAATRAGDRVRIAAVDVDCKPLASDFAGAKSDAVDGSVRDLQSRTPLGSTDLTAALETAAGLFADASRSKAIIYVGDGPGFAGVDAQEFARVLELLRSQHVVVSGLGIGPQVNWPCLAAVATATGGMLIVPSAGESVADAGKLITALAIQPVAWPENVAFAAEQKPLPRMLPARLPPLRTDRDTVVLLAGAPAATELSFSLSGAGGSPVPVALPLPDAQPRDEHAYLGVLARNAWDTDGIFLPLLGRQGMELARNVIRGEAAALAQLSKQAEASGAHDSAVRLAEASLRRDPDNPEAAVVRLTAARQTEELPAAEAVAPPKPGWKPPSRTAEDDSDLADTEAMRQVRAQQLEQETAIRIRDARQLLSTDPDRARDLLKEAQQLVRDSADLAPGDRDRLLRQLEGRIRESIVRSRAKLECDLAAERKAAIGRERDRLNTELHRREERIKQLVERYNALVEEGIRDGYAQSERYPTVVNGESIIGYEPPTRAFVEAERVVGEEIAKEAPELWANHPVPMTARVIGRTAPLVARILDYDAENARTKRDQQRGFMDALHLVDVAAIPYPDDPPIHYPKADRWREINRLRAKYRPAAFDPTNVNEKRIYEALEKPTGPKFEFNQNSLKDLEATIEAQFGIPVTFDQKALDGVDLNEATITESASGISLRSALRRILANQDMTYLVKDETLVITTKEAASTDMVPRVYAVGDLVLPVEPMNAVNPFNLGGTSTQDQNRLPPVGGAGGLGAGGLCWVAREVYGVHDLRWIVFRSWLTTEAPTWLHDLYAAHGPAFADWIHDKPGVKAALRIAMDAVVEPRLAGASAIAGQFQVAEAKARVARREKPDIDLPAAEPAAEPADRVGLPATVLGATDLTAAVATYLPKVGGEHASAKPAIDAREAALRLAQLRVSAAELGKQGEFARAADLISAAIACGHAEPWMYESLALAMEAAGRPKADVERVLLSGADFATSPVDLLSLANYLARFGSDRQALRLCRQVVMLDPANREAFGLAMTLADRADDVAALKWSCPGVLANEWPVGQQDIATRAARLAEATIERLAKDGKADDAAAFRAAIEQAKARDLVIEIAWTGDADVDMLVEEPTGTVCSREASRSTSGGTLLADERCPTDPSGQVHRERYAATLAFPGTYRALVRRSTGKVNADTITVEMTMHKGTKHEQTIRKQVPVSADEQVLTVDLPAGRRQQPLADAQVAQDVAVQQAVGKAILSQQLASLSDPGTLSELSKSRDATGDAQRQSGVPFFGSPGPVGNQPVITTLPEGVNATFRAVVSHDRRYVRVTATPLFSGIGNVTTFNFSGGGVGGGMG